MAWRSVSPALILNKLMDVFFTKLPQAFSLCRLQAHEITSERIDCAGEDPPDPRVTRFGVAEGKGASTQSVVRLLVAQWPHSQDSSLSRFLILWRSTSLHSASFIELETRCSVRGRTLTPAPQFWSCSKKAPGRRSPSGRLLSPFRIPSPFDVDI